MFSHCGSFRVCSVCGICQSGTVCLSLLLVSLIDYVLSLWLFLGMFCLWHMSVWHGLLVLALGVIDMICVVTVVLPVYVLYVAYVSLL